ncbi:major facilitator superfamily domain-containing protein [Suillus clintonianus]|uniref:major facilitator superfamily domain-containing protein n=1 Tax=Suillus clintonianus TaxID=1904413 RepID=UPI001B877B8B|nr:major facilitator superfamily domain-containing protein [Suillus clintonianus]KAG2146249.1 major facilitator superfamily domain-containing protein [Suillus clintonianus]
MIARQNDEETPLLQRPEQAVASTPLPWDQFWIILFLQFSDSLVFQTLAPFTPQLIKDIGVTHGDESQVGHYVGILQSSYYTAQALTILHWSQLSDHIGRKPVILTALFAIAVSMFSFGLSKTFAGLVISRAFCGAFNGSNGVIKSMVMDVTDATNLPKAYGYMPLPWMLGTLVGPLVGGSLSRPADRFPGIFGGSELLKTNPYLLPCAVPAIFASVAWLVTYFRFKECGNESVSIKAPFWELIKGWLLPQSYAKPFTPSSNALAISQAANSEDVSSKPLPLCALLTPKVLIVTASYVTMALFYMAFSSILPVFYSTPIELGGLSLDPPRIGAILAASGVAHGIFQLLFYARLHDRFGAGAIHIFGVGSGVPIIILFPVINALARVHGLGLAVWMCIGVQHVLATGLVMCYPAAPNRASLGATNGVVQLVVAGARIMGPASAASVFSLSMQQGRDAWLVLLYYFPVILVYGKITNSMTASDPILDVYVSFMKRNNCLYCITVETT